ncbi:hypothetical protein Taro_031417 [Colocasia esculenta]|uniref:Pectinesterase n=1 Tax=Colocasia esculenta TaxID=4460 RepID=A0A843VRV7_COLES|nr:hypothetical protein [Colocasia esculenta]
MSRCSKDETNSPSSPSFPSRDANLCAGRGSIHGAWQRTAPACTCGLSFDSCRGSRRRRGRRNPATRRHTTGWLRGGLMELPHSGTALRHGPREGTGGSYPFLGRMLQKGGFTGRGMTGWKEAKAGGGGGLVAAGGGEQENMNCSHLGPAVTTTSPAPVFQLVFPDTLRDSDEMGGKSSLFASRLCLFFLSSSLWIAQCRGPPPSGDGPEVPVVGDAYMNWVKQMGSPTHSPYARAANRLTPCKVLTVDKKNPGVGRFASVQEAINSLPAINLCRVVIYVHAGIYTEKVSIPATKAYITLVGAGMERTVIQWGDTADRAGMNGQPLGTFGSATFAVNSPYFVAKNITFKNLAPLPPSGILGKQAVALRISADAAAFVGCSFHGAQDTLYDHAGRHYFRDCYIEGSVDFIFGDGRSLYEGCHLHAITNSYGALTAQNRGSMLEETGFSFIRCKVTGSGALYLGRAWGTFSRVVFAFTFMDRTIIPNGWYNWGDKNREMTVFYGQYKCSGPGANFTGRVPWSRELTAQQAQPFLSLTFIDAHEWLGL